MAVITLEQSGMSLPEAKKLMGTNSWLKGDVVIITPEAELFAVRGDNEARKELFKFSKEKLIELRDVEGFKSGIREQKTTKDGTVPAREYDHLYISFDAEETRHLRENVPDFSDRLLAAVREASAGRLGGVKSAAISTPHADTANLHMHIMLHRFAVDLQKQSIETGDDLSKVSNKSEFLARLNDALSAQGLPKMSDFVTKDKQQGVFADVSNQEAKLQVADQIIEAGGIAVQRADAPPLASISVEQESLIKMEGVARGEAERLQVEIMKLQEAQKQAVERVTLAQQAQAALAERDGLKANIDELTKSNAELEGKVAGLGHQLETQQVIIETQDGEIKVARETIESMQGVINDQTQALQDRYTQILEQDEKIKSLESDIEVKGLEMAEMQEQLNKNELALGEANQNIETLSAANDQLQEQVERIAHDRDEIKSDLNNARGTMAAQSEMMAQMREEMARFRADMETMRAQNEALSQNLSAVQQQNESLSQNLTSVQKQLEEKSGDNAYKSIVSGRVKEMTESGELKSVPANDKGVIGRTQRDGEQALVHINKDGDALVITNKEGAVLSAEGNPQKVREMQEAIASQVQQAKEAAKGRDGGEKGPGKGGRDDGGR